MYKNKLSKIRAIFNLIKLYIQTVILFINFKITLKFDIILIKCFECYVLARFVSHMKFRSIKNYTV